MTAYRAILALLLASTAEAAIIYSTPTPEYLSSTTVIGFADPDEALLDSISGGALTVTFSTAMRSSTVGINWATWGAPPDTESSTPRVLWSGLDDNFDPLTFVTLSFSAPVSIFGFEAEPGFFGVHGMTANFYRSGLLVATINRDVEGQAGAVLFAAQAEAFDAVTFASDVDWAAGQFRYRLAEVPEPATWVMVLSIVTVLRKRRV